MPATGWSAQSLVWKTAHCNDYIYTNKNITKGVLLTSSKRQLSTIWKAGHNYNAITLYYVRWYEKLATVQDLLLSMVYIPKTRRDDYMMLCLHVKVRHIGSPI